MKIQVGKKYRMKNYPTPYLYVLIIAKESDFGLSEFNAKSFYQDKDKENGIDLYAGIVVYCGSNKDINREPDLLSWGEDGSWDGSFLLDNNALVEEVV